MKQCIYVMYDKVADLCGPIATSHNEATMRRQLRQENLKVTEEVLKDYKVIILGTYNTEGEQAEIELDKKEIELVEIVRHVTDEQEIAEEG